MSAPLPSVATIRLPRTAYLVVLFLFVGAIPVAFGDNASHTLSDTATGGAQFSGFVLTWQLLVFLVPILAAAYIARTATVVSAEGLRVRAVFGTRTIAWTQLRGLSVTGRAVYAVLADGSVRLPCVRLAHLSALARYSNGRLPPVRDATPKPAPAKRTRR